MNIRQGKKQYAEWSSDKWLNWNSFWDLDMFILQIWVLSSPSGPGSASGRTIESCVIYGATQPPQFLSGRGWDCVIYPAALYPPPLSKKITTVEIEHEKIHWNWAARNRFAYHVFILCHTACYTAWSLLTYGITIWWISIHLFFIVSIK